MESRHNSNQDFQAAESSFEQDFETLDPISKEKHARRFQRGLKWMAAGALTLVLSFGINYLCFHSDVDFCIPMYVLTSLGALGCLKGMMDIF